MYNAALCYQPGVTYTVMYDDKMMQHDGKLDLHKYKKHTCI